jgi:O-acetylhomoserine/O-acetylserine sulfhydrylase-like pyridoxal-dependent enzyme
VDIVDAGTFDWGQHRDRFFQFRANSETEGSGEISPWHTSGRRAFGIRAQFEVLRDIGSCLSAMSAHQLMLGLETLWPSVRASILQHSSSGILAGGATTGDLGVLPWKP